MTIFEIMLSMQMTQYKFFNMYADGLIEVTGKKGDQIEGIYKNSDNTFTVTINAV